MFDQIRGHFSPAAEYVRRMLAAAGGTYQAADIGSDRPTAHIAGTPYDKTRLDVFDEAVRELETLAPTILQATGVDAAA